LEIEARCRLPDDVWMTVYTPPCRRSIGWSLDLTATPTEHIEQYLTHVTNQQFRMQGEQVQVRVGEEWQRATGELLRDRLTTNLRDLADLLAAMQAAVHELGKRTRRLTGDGWRRQVTGGDR
jgi:hypothetical protein